MWVLLTTDTVRASTMILGPFTSAEEAQAWAESHLDMPDGMEVLWEVEPVIGLDAWS